MRHKRAVVGTVDDTQVVCTCEGMVQPECKDASVT